MSSSEPSGPSAPMAHRPAGGLAQLLATLAAPDVAAADDLAARICQLACAALAVDAAALFLGRDDAVCRAAAGLAAAPPAGVPGGLAPAALDRLHAWSRQAGYGRAELIALPAPDGAPFGLLALFAVAAAPLEPADRDLLSAGVADALIRAGVAPAARRLLLVEDDADNREAMTSLLSIADFEVTAVDSGEAALAAFAPGRFELVLTDLSLPDLDGWRVAHAIKQAAPTIPIAVITGWGVHLEEPELQRRGVDLVIKKPLDPRTLLNELENLLQVGGRKPSA